MASKTTRLILAACLALCLGSCGGTWSSRKPSSTGQPYEVVLEGDTDNILTHMLSADMPALPQPEPMFDLIQVRRGRAQGSYLLVRSRIIVDINHQHKGYAVKMTRDENAKPQVVIRIFAQSTQQLRKHLDANKLRNLIDQSELNHLATIIKLNPDKQKEVRRLFGIDMKIPASMDASKLGKGFAWYSNNANTGMQCILLMKVSDHAAGPVLQAKVDSILRKNMPGETDQMYMTIPHLKERGLWEMKGDAMGGSYVMRQVGNVVAIAFVYAPEMKKRNLIKQLEAVLTTIKHIQQ